VNAFDQGVFSTSADVGGALLQSIKLPCSAMVRDIFLLRAFEAGADGVVVIGCPQGKCQRIDGNIRAGKRVAWVQKLLSEIGLDGRRLVFAGSDTVDLAIANLLKDMMLLGLSPVKKETGISK